MIGQAADSMLIGDPTIGTSIGKATIPVDPRHAWLPRAARRMYPGWRH
ncbi:MAG: hypothetical protein ACN6RD_18025 [Stenotrophomonas maltophilia]